MKTAEPLDGQDGPALQQVFGCRKSFFRLGNCFLIRGVQRDQRAAGRAAIRLRVKSAAGRIIILCEAVSAHGKMPHGSRWPVVGDIFNNGIAWAAICTVCERVKVSAVGRFKKFGKAILTNSGIRSNLRCHMAIGI